MAVIGGAVALGLHSGRGALGVEATVAATMAAVVLHVVLHEAGHLVVALLAGLRVTGVRISLLAGHRSMVVVRPEPSSVALAPRMVAFMLGGPVANLGCPDAYALAVQVRALAEIYLGDVAQAERSRGQAPHRAFRASEQVRDLGVGQALVVPQHRPGPGRPRRSPRSNADAAS